MAHLPTILIVDDDPAIRTMLVEKLALEGYQTKTAGNGHEALDIVEKSGPRVVLLDLLMPVVDGRGVIDALRAVPDVRVQQKIILMSALTYLEQNRDLEADSTLTKP